MAFKIGSFFDSLLGTGSFNVGGGAQSNNKLIEAQEEIQEIKEVLKEQQHIFKENLKTRIDLESKLVAAQVRGDQRRITEYTNRLNTLSNSINTVTNDIADTSRELDEATKKAKALEKALTTQADTVKKKLDNIFNFSQVTDFGSAMSSFRGEWQQTIEELNKGTKTQYEYAKAMRESRRQLAANLTTSFFNTDSKSITSSAGNMLAGLTKNVLSKFLGPVISTGLVGAFTGAVRVGMEYNDTLVDLERQTSGVVSATRLGYNAYGQNEKGTKSLARTLAAANLTTQEFSKALTSYIGTGTEAIGQTIGFKNNLASSKEDLQSLGISLSRYSKLYNADFEGFSRNITKNFGASFKEVGSYIDESTLSVRALGLNVSAYAANLTEASDLVGEYYFKDGIEGQIQLAKAATLAGTSVKQLISGLKGFNTISNVFEQQQKASALGMRNLAANAQRIFAMAKTGDIAGAAKLKLESAGKDITRLGLADKSGQITARGFDYLNAAGFSEDDIKVLQRMSLSAKQAGITLDQAFNKEDLPAKTRRLFEDAEKGNMKMSERWDTLWIQLQQSFLEPLGRFVMPTLEALTWGLSWLGKIITKISDSFDWLGEKISYVGGLFGIGGDSSGGTEPSGVSKAAVIGGAGFAASKAFKNFKGSGANNITSRFSGLGSSINPKTAGVLKSFGKVKGLGGAGSLLTGISSGVETYEKTGSVTKGAVVGGSTGLGALGGMKAGAAIGAVGGPIGIAVGGLLGAAVGGIFGERLGKWFSGVKDDQDEVMEHQKEKIDEVYNKQDERDKKKNAYANTPALKYFPKITTPILKTMSDYKPVPNTTLASNPPQQKVLVDLKVTDNSGNKFRVSPIITQQ